MGSSAFREVIVWEGWIVIGFGYDLHLVKLEGNDTRSIHLGSYFGHLYPKGHRLLIASCDKLFCLTPEGAVLWSSEVLALDGVIVDGVGGGIVYGQGEWDPPGGWEPFHVSLTTGAVTKAAAR